MPLMIKLNRNIMKINLCLDNGHFITVITVLCLIVIMIETGAMMMIPVFNNISEYFDQLISLFSVSFILVEMKVEFWLSAIILIVLFWALVKSIKKQKM